MIASIAGNSFRKFVGWTRLKGDKICNIVLTNLFDCHLFISLFKIFLFRNIDVEREREKRLEYVFDLNYITSYHG